MNKHVLLLASTIACLGIIKSEAGNSSFGPEKLCEPAAEVIDRQSAVCVPWETATAINILPALYWSLFVVRYR
jgi:hypothetical protein